MKHRNQIGDLLPLRDANELSEIRESVEAGDHDIAIRLLKAILFEAGLDQ